MRPHRIGLLLGIILAIFTVLLRMEWPLPEFVQKKLHAIFEDYGLGVNYQKATFDILGGVRLQGVSARYEGLLDINASQFLVRIWPDKSIDLAIDHGQFHTGFLLVALPELIGMDGRISLHPNKSIEIPQLRLQAGSLVVNVQGQGYPEKVFKSSGLANNKEGSSLGKAEWIGALASILCRDPHNLWLAEIRLEDDSVDVTISGDQIDILSYDLIDPVFRFNYPLKNMVVQLSELSGADILAQNIAFYYDAESKNHWRVNVGGVDYQDYPTARMQLSGNTDLFRVGDFSAWKEMYGWALFDGSLAQFDQLNLEKQSGRIWGEFSGSLLNLFGLKLTSDEPFATSGSFANQKIDFVAASGEGIFYRLPYGASWVEGQLGAKGVGLDYFKVWDLDPREFVEGSLFYEFGSQNAKYDLWGEYNPGRLPWFGDEWNEAFDRFHNFRPAFACKLVDIKGSPIKVDGVGYQDGAIYHKLELGPTVASFVSAHRATDVVLATRKNNEKAHGDLRWRPESPSSQKTVFGGTIKGVMLPKTLAKSYFDEPIEALENLEFRQLPLVTAELTKDTYDLTLKTLFPLKFYSIDIEGCSLRVVGSEDKATISPLSFGFAGGSGEATVRILSEDSSEGEISINGASFGKWSLFGPLSQALEGTFLGFTSLALDNAHGRFIYNKQTLSVPEFEFKGPQHALSVWGDMNTQTDRLNFRARLNTLGGDRPSLPILAPIIRPITSVLEARLEGTLDDPDWNVKLRIPRF